MKFTFKEIAALSVVLVMGSFLSYTLYNPIKGDGTGVVQGAFVGLIVLCSNYLFGSTSGSHAKDAASQDIQSKMVDALQNSTPTETKN